MVGRNFLVAVLITAILLGTLGVYLVSRGQLSSEGVTTPYVEISPVIIKDHANRTITIRTPPKRVVAIGPGMLRLVSYLGAIDLVVGVEEVEKSWGAVGRDYAMAYHELFKDLPLVGPGGPGKPPSPELILSLRPDLVIMSSSYLTYVDPDKLSSEVNATVIVLDYSPVTSVDLSLFYDALKILGKVLGREERATQLISYVQSLLRDLSNRTRGLSGTNLRVYVGAVSYRGAQPFTATQLPYPPLAWLGIESIVDKLGRRGFINVDFDYLIKEDPDVVFVDEGNLNIVIQDFEKDPLKYCSLKAFRNGEVYGLIPFNYYHSNIATALANAYFIGKVLLPERFADIDPAKKADEIFKVFLGKPLYQDFISGGYRGYTNLAQIFRCS